MTGCYLSPSHNSLLHLSSILYLSSSVMFGPLSTVSFLRLIALGGRFVGGWPQCLTTSKKEKGAPRTSKGEEKAFFALAPFRTECACSACAGIDGRLRCGALRYKARQGVLMLIKIVNFCVLASLFRAECADLAFFVFDLWNEGA